jgi:hypothetical protein
VSTGDRSQLGRTAQAGERDKFLDVVFVSAPGFRVGNVGEPFELGRHLGQLPILRRRQRPLFNRNQVFCHVAPASVPTALPRGQFLTR